MKQSKKKGMIIAIVIIALAAIAAAIYFVGRNAASSKEAAGTAVTQTASASTKAETLKVACVGDSITYGYGLAARETDSYPAQLQKMAGTRYTVENFGISGRTVQLSGDKPYVLEDIFENSKAYGADIVLLMLGTNDTKTINWNQAQFEQDLKFLVTSYTALPKAPKVYLLLPPPIFRNSKQKTSPNEEVLENGVIPSIKKVAAQEKVAIIDVNAAFQNKPELFSDGCHPNEKGAALLAKTVFNALQQAQ